MTNQEGFEIYGEYTFRDLVGSPKQIEWATKIRAQMFADVALRLTHGSDCVAPVVYSNCPMESGLRPVDATFAKRVAGRRAIILKSLAFQSNVAFFIDRRQVGAERVIADLTAANSKKFAELESSLTA